MGNNAPNLDGMDISDLMPFWNKHQSGRAYRDLFPAGGKGTKRAAADLANYASNAHAARSCRAKGAIRIALDYERVCERIYEALPPFARW